MFLYVSTSYGYFDWTYLLLIVAMIFALYAQSRVRNAFDTYSRQISKSGLTGADVARKLLEKNGIKDIKVEQVHGDLTDHFDPRDKVLRLSDPVYNGRSVSAIGVAAHETGHAIQHEFGYAPLAIRNTLVPVASLSSRAAIPLIFVGFMLTYLSSMPFGYMLVDFGIVLYSVIVLFHVVTLPVEFNASSRALSLIEENHCLSNEELPGAKKVLDAAALTYVASTASAVLTLLRLVLNRNRRR